MTTPRLGKGINRRRMLLLAAATALLPTVAIADTDIEAISALKPGDFTWHPERSPTGPVAIIVSLKRQLVFVYRNGIRIGVSTVSSGKDGYATPTGVFTILQKDRNHHSSKYNDASMPNTERLTWSGVALHAGGLPGYPSSHGCIHLPLAFSKLLFGVTTVGTPVIVSEGEQTPVDIANSGLVISKDAAAEAAVAAASVQKHGASAAAPDPATVSIIVSSADKEIMVLQAGAVIAKGPATIDFPDKPLGFYTYILTRNDEANGNLHWQAIGYSDSDQSENAQQANGTLFRIHGDPTVIKTMQSLMQPGSVMVTTDLPLHPDTRTGTDFVVMDATAS